MEKQFLRQALFKVEIKFLAVEFIKQDMSYEDAKGIIGDFRSAYSENKDLIECLDTCEESFGFSSVNMNGVKVCISAYMPEQLLEQYHTCPRRSEAPYNIAPHDLDQWKLINGEKICTYCGSLHPETVIEMVEKLGAGILEQSTKEYKWYVNRKNVPNASFGGIKFYTMHFSREQVDKLNSLIE